MKQGCFCQRDGKAWQASDHMRLRKKEMEAVVEGFRREQALHTASLLVGVEDGSGTCDGLKR